jgi:hypothetical protein
MCPHLSSLLTSPLLGPTSLVTLLAPPSWLRAFELALPFAHKALFLDPHLALHTPHLLHLFSLPLRTIKYALLFLCLHGFPTRMLVLSGEDFCMLCLVLYPQYPEQYRKTVTSP